MGASLCHRQTPDVSVSVPDMSGSLPEVSGDVSVPSVGGGGGVDVDVAVPSVGVDASAPSASIDLPGEWKAPGTCFARSVGRCCVFFALLVQQYANRIRTFFFLFFFGPVCEIVWHGLIAPFFGIISMVFRIFTCKTRGFIYQPFILGSLNPVCYCTVQKHARILL